MRDWHINLHRQYETGAPGFCIQAHTALCDIFKLLQLAATQLVIVKLFIVSLHSSNYFSPSFRKPECRIIKPYRQVHLSDNYLCTTNNGKIRLLNTAVIFEPKFRYFLPAVSFIGLLFCSWRKRCITERKPVLL